MSSHTTAKNITVKVLKEMIQDLDDNEKIAVMDEGADTHPIQDIGWDGVLNCHVLYYGDPFEQDHES